MHPRRKSAICTQISFFEFHFFSIFIFFTISRPDQGSRVRGVTSNLFWLATLLIHDKTEETGKISFLLTLHYYSTSTASTQQTFLEWILYADANDWVEFCRTENLYFIAHVYHMTYSLAELSQRYVQITIICLCELEMSLASWYIHIWLLWYLSNDGIFFKWWEYFGGRAHDLNGFTLSVCAVSKLYFFLANDNIISRIIIFIIFPFFFW